MKRFRIFHMEFFWEALQGVLQVCQRHAAGLPLQPLVLQVPPTDGGHRGGTIMGFTTGPGGHWIMHWIAAHRGGIRRPPPRPRRA